MNPESRNMSQPVPMPGRFRISVNGQVINLRFDTLDEALAAAPLPTPAHLVEILDGWSRTIVSRNRS